MLGNNFLLNHHSVGNTPSCTDRDEGTSCVYPIERVQRELRPNFSVFLKVIVAKDSIFQFIRELFNVFIVIPIVSRLKQVRDVSQFFVHHMDSRCD